MSKNIDPGFRTDLAGDVQTLASCWKMTRQFDQKDFYYTDHDQDIEFPVSSGIVYKTANGFTRSAIKATDDLTSQGMTVLGVFDDDEISDQDLIKKLFDNAVVEIFVVNYANLARGPISYKYGRFGTVQRQSRSGFQVEFVDLTQALNQPHDERIQPTCRANVGDNRCNNSDLGLPGDKRNPVPIVVPDRLDSTAYILGDVIRVRTGPDPLVFPVTTIINGGFETGDLTGWNVTAGAAAALQDGILGGGEKPYAGLWMMRPSDSSAVDQIIDLQPLPDFIAANVDAGQVSIKQGRIWQQDAESDTGRIQCFAVNAAGADISTIYDSGFQSYAEDVWEPVEWTGVLPALTRQLRVECRCPNNPGASRVYFDELTITLEDSAQTANSSFAYEDVIYRCTVAGTTAASAPTYDPTIGNPTADGTATFVAEFSYMMAGEVEGVTDGRNFTALPTLFTDPLFDNPWFNLGGIVWETGANTNWVSEIRSADPPAFNLKFKTPFDIQPGDKFRVYPGCDKRLTTCINKWVHNPATAGTGNKDNTRAEPHLAGLDAGSQYPDAQS